VIVIDGINVIIAVARVGADSTHCQGILESRVYPVYHPAMKSSSVLLVFASLVTFAAPAVGAGSVDAGRAAFNQTCLNCHYDPPTAYRFDAARFNAAYLTFVFELVPAMNDNLNLGAQTINDIATYLGAPDSNDTDRILDWGEDTYPQLLFPARQPTQQLFGYSYRFYQATGVYVATKDNDVWFLDSRKLGASILNLGTVRDFLDQMPNGR